MPHLSSRRRLAALFLAVLPAACSSAPADQDERMAWWRDARFGMFIHWGLYAIPAGKWDDRTDHGEWIRDTARIGVTTYDGLRTQWNPENFDADAWAHAAAAAGMKYLVITSKHHDGFCLWDSDATDWDVGSTPVPRDILRELADACQRHGVVFCTYHSIMDWHHPDYLPRRPWEAATRPAVGADFERFEKYLHTQVTEVVQRYEPGVMWFDGEWEPSWNHERGVRLFELCRRLNPAMIVNNRVDVHRGGMGGFSNAKEAVGDFATPEQEIPAAGLPGVDWESCMTMNDHWGWNAADNNWKSTTVLVRNLIDVASKGGNYLLNVGPRADGTFPPQAIERLQQIGAWMEANGDAITGTSASPFDPEPWCRWTRKRDGDLTKLYLHVFERPVAGVVTLPQLGSQVQRAYPLANPDALLDQRIGNDWGWSPQVFNVPEQPEDSIATVYVFEVDGEPVIRRAPAITADGEAFVTELRVQVAPRGGDEPVHFTVDGTDPTVSSPRAGDPIALAETATVKARAIYEHRGRQVAGPLAQRTFTKVEPLPAVKANPQTPGLRVERFAGDWTSIPVDLDTRTPDATSTAATVALPAERAGEKVLLSFRGFVDVPADEMWRFELSSDDGSKLWIDGQLVIDNDGLHAVEEQKGAIALQKGLHAIHVAWFNRTGEEALALQWAAAGQTFAPVPADKLRH